MKDDANLQESSINRDRALTCSECVGSACIRGLCAHIEEVEREGNAWIWEQKF